MMKFVPVIYPDELFFSFLARCYAHSGLTAYSYALEEMLEKKNIRPDMEYINRLAPTFKEIVTGMLPMRDIILFHTMFPSSRFTDHDRLLKGYHSLLEQEGDVHLLLPIPKTREIRYLRYCPLCEKESREKYGEAYWKRSAMLRDARICPVHRCRIKETIVEISGKQSPRLFVAEEQIEDMEPEYVNGGIELELSKYMLDVFHAPIDFKNDVPIGSFLTARLEGTPYISARGMAKHISLLCDDLKDYYRELPEEQHPGRVQMQKIFSGYRWDFSDICKMALFLGISRDDIVHPVLPDRSQTERFNETVAGLYEKGLGCHRISKIVGSSAATALKANRKKQQKQRNYAVRAGMQKEDWGKMDEEMLPAVRAAIREIYGGGDERPRRVTEFAVTRHLNLPSKRLDYLPKCRKLIKAHYEEYPHYWCREVVWAYERLKQSDGAGNITWKKVDRLVNLRKSNMEKALPYLSQYTDEKTADEIKALLR